MKKLYIAPGDRFGSWTILSEAPQSKNNRRFNARCECGKEKIVHLSAITSGGSTRCHSCALRSESGRRTHGASSRERGFEPEYVVWTGMKARCNNPNHTSYGRYGAKGIRVCDRWMHSFENFLADMGRKPTPKHTLERKKSKLDYSPDNCVWATYKEQARNLSTNRLITFNGETHCLAEWAELIGISGSTLGARLKAGWTVERALTEPVQNLKCSQVQLDRLSN